MKRSSNLLLIVGLLLLTGCWDSKELTQLAIIQGTGIDVSDEGDMPVKVTLGVLNPTGQGMSSSQASPGFKMNLVQGRGRSIATAIAHARLSAGKNFYWGNNDSLIFSEEVAKEGILGHIDYFGRFPEAVLRQHIFTTSGNAEDFLKLSTQTGKQIPKLLRNYTSLGFSIRTNLLELIGMVNDAGHIAIVPRIGIRSLGEGDPALALTGISVLKKGKLQATIPPKLRDELLWMRGELKETVITVPVLDQKATFSLIITETQTKLTPIIKNGRFIINVHVTNWGEYNQNETDMKPLDIQDNEKMEQQAKLYIGKRLNDMIQYAQQEIGLDVFGYGEKFNNRYPKVMKQLDQKDEWDTVFKNIEIQVKQDLIIERTGLITEIYHPTEEK
ncbi:Ger(x)C family spore germination protein [Aureibacillus halotolerans]|uniref:Ger(X)C family germination protein n=1 Tax=Aureibacillus halotolerans TaxID=1508390 RepID=A0A4R6U660_9BACI|nr:Ger(x)C family spore germination protein [Aureibacillus halotolerans]TDQ41990.1 Ger(x)C family germination protein [Aureibacillus halotolerans]